MSDLNRHVRRMHTRWAVLALSAVAAYLALSWCFLDSAEIPSSTRYICGNLTSVYVLVCSCCTVRDTCYAPLAGACV